jgi:hypothetical protein
MEIARFSRLFKIATMAFAVIVIFSACANQATLKVKQAERAVEKEQKKKAKEFSDIKKSHYQMQTEETKKRMKATVKNQKKYQRQRNKESLWDKLFGK